jgi:hypothetical protein
VELRHDLVKHRNDVLAGFDVDRKQSRMSRMKWRKSSSADGVVTLTDPSGRIVIEKHTHHYGPWLIKDTWLDERAGETEASEAEARRLAEEYLDTMASAPTPARTRDGQAPAPVVDLPRPLRADPPTIADSKLQTALELLILPDTPRNRAAIGALADALRAHP